MGPPIFDTNGTAFDRGLLRTDLSLRGPIKNLLFAIADDKRGVVSDCELPRPGPSKIAVDSDAVLVDTVPPLTFPDGATRRVFSEDMTSDTAGEESGYLT